MVRRSIAGQACVDCTLGACAEQEMCAEITVAEMDRTGTVYCSVLPPGSDRAAIHIGSMGKDNAQTVPVPEVWVHTIRVWLMVKC